MTLQINTPPALAGDPAASREERVIGLRGCVTCHRITPGHLEHHCTFLPVGKGLWRYIGQRDNWTCQLCNAPIDPRIPRGHPRGASLDHRLPRSDGGGSELENLQIAHALCNWFRSNLPLETLDERWQRRLTAAWRRRARAKRAAYIARRAVRRAAGRPTLAGST